MYLTERKKILDPYLIHNSPLLQDFPSLPSLELQLWYHVTFTGTAVVAGTHQVRQCRQDTPMTGSVSCHNAAVRLYTKHELIVIILGLCYNYLPFILSSAISRPSWPA